MKSLRVDVALALSVATLSFFAQHLLVLVLAAMAVHELTFSRWFKGQHPFLKGWRSLAVFAYLFALWTAAATLHAATLYAAEQPESLLRWANGGVMALGATWTLSAAAVLVWRILERPEPS